jgi:hypothetical protein
VDGWIRDRLQFSPDAAGAAGQLEGGYFQRGQST